MRMNARITKDYEENIKKWYEEVKKCNTNTLDIELKASNDFLVLQNFFLICLKEPEKKLNLRIQCQTSDEFRVRHYLYTCKKLAHSVLINGCRYVENESRNEYSFLRILPLTIINIKNYEFFSKRVSDIELMLDSEIGYDFLLTLKDKNSYKEEITNEQKWLIRTSMSNLYDDVPGLVNFANERRVYFSTDTFKNKVRNMPFLAFLIFSCYDRVNQQDRAEDYKKEKKERTHKTRIILKSEEMPQALPLDEEVMADISNAWDISDGILQLLENVVEHAGNCKVEEKTGNYKSGTGVLSIRIHKNEEENKFLKGEFDQYFKGYDYRYKREYEEKREELIIENTEKDYLSKKHSILKSKLNEGRFVEEKELIEYNKVREKIQRRREERNKIKYFLDIRIADISGKYMCDVFRKNLAGDIDSDGPHFENIQVRSFFDPNRQEQQCFDKYYQGKNIIHHYGLQIFASVIGNNDGCFFVRSHSTEKKSTYNTTQYVEDGLEKLMEGTRYQILLPFRRRPVQANSMINASISYHTKQLEQRKTIDEHDEQLVQFYNRLDRYDREIESKETVVKELQRYLLWDEGLIYVFDISRIKPAAVEVFCKALILYIAEGVKDSHVNNIAIINCDASDFISIIRLFAICYDKNGVSGWMKQTQVYLSGKDTREEFLLSGENVQVLLTRVAKLAFSRRIHPICVQTLQKVLEKKQQSGFYSDKDVEEDNFQYVPFDLLLKKNERTIFENNVSMILKNNIQSVESGCKIEPTHMRIGSKIHNNAFYEAELLFYNNYYTNRFAYLLFLGLQKMLGDDLGKKPICFIGYETYSEMLLCELKHIWEKQSNEDCIYMVYEIKTDGRINLRYKEQFKPDMQSVFIVPINSTLTTFNKLQAEAEKELPVLEVAAYMGVIQIRDEAGNGEKCSTIEKMYWDDIRPDKRQIFSKRLLGKGKYASYLVDVSCMWEDPLKCSQCFPNDCLFETPLIETNKTSVVPSQLIGLKEEFKGKEIKMPKKFSDSGHVDSLKDYFYYGHVERDNNHFCYYIRTAAYFQRYQTEIKSWLSKVKKDINNDLEHKVVSYNVIVNPLHFSNTGFVEAVNEVVFNGASYVLRIEPEKEFRDNIQTKYSDLSVLYNNLLASEGQSEVNFYYVDDNIITGKAFHRIKHLVLALFPAKSQDQRVKVNIFRSVIVLLNRLSEYSINNYVKDVGNYYAYISLNISNLRSYEDACFLCKKEMDNQKLADYSSTNSVNQYWEERKEAYKLKSLPEIKQKVLAEQAALETEKQRIRSDRPFLRMKATHMLNEKMPLLGTKKNDTVEVYKLLVNQIVASPVDKYEAMTAYVYAAAYPFIVYRKSCREAIFHMVIILLESFVVGETIKDFKRRIEEGRDTEAIPEYLEKEMIQVVSESNGITEIVKNVKEEKEFLKFLIKVSVELKSNYIIRKDRMSKVIEKYYNFVVIDKEKEGWEKREELEQFAQYFVSLVKKLISLNSDESKSTYFEDVLIGEMKDINFKTLTKENSLKKRGFQEYLDKMKIALFIENTCGLYDAICDLNKKPILLNEYYFKNYVRMLQLNNVSGWEKQKLVSGYFVSVYQYLDKSVNGMAGKEKESRNDFQRYIEYYCKLAAEIKKLTESENVQFLLAQSEWVLKIDDKDNVVFDKETKRYGVFAHSENEERPVPLMDTDRIEEALAHAIMDTVSIDKNIVIIEYKKPLLMKQNTARMTDEVSYFQSVFMVIKYKNCVQKKHLELIRRVLLFRNMMIIRFANDFSNNVMQNWMQQAWVIRQLEKARAFIHTKDNDSGDLSNVWNICKRFFYGTPYEKEIHNKEWGDVKEGCILELMTDIRIGRINLLLLSNSEFRTDNRKGECEFREAKDYIEELKKAYYWKNVCIYNQRNERIENAVIEDIVYDSKLEKNRGGKYNRIGEYLIYLIYETIHSAAIYGRKEKIKEKENQNNKTQRVADDKKVNIKIYKDGIFLFICNKMTKEQDGRSILNGLARRGNGISLAVICEYFIKEYDNRYVKLVMDDEEFKIGLPIFAEEHVDESS